MGWSKVLAALDARAQRDDDALTRIVATALFLAGGITAIAYGFFVQTDSGRMLYLAIAAGLILLGGVCSWAVGRPRAVTAAGYLSIVMIGALLTIPDPAATIPLYFLWPTVALAYFRSPAVLVGACILVAVVVTPVLIVGGTTESRIVALGAVSTAAVIGVLVAVMRGRQLRLQRRLEEASRTDPLTGLLNRRAFVPSVTELVGRAARADRATTGADLSVVILDVDHFKRYNDANGHLWGDEALRRLAGILRQEAGPGALVCRHGGEEFVIVLPETLSAAGRFADRVAQRLASEDVEPRHRLSVSCGLVDLEQADAALRRRAEVAPHFGEPVAPERTPQVLIALADDALYAAKHAGRRRAAHWTDGRIVVEEPVGPERPAHAADDSTRGGVAAAATRAGALPANGPASATPGRPTPTHATRERLIQRIAVGMFACGALNCIVALAFVDYSTFTREWQYVITAVLIATAAVVAIMPSGRRTIELCSLWGVLIVAATLATVSPILSAPLFCVWAVALGAFVGSWRFTAFMVVWAGVWFGAALVVLPADGPKAVTWVGMVINLGLVAFVIAMLRDHEARLHQGLREAADVDPLTGLLNRRAFNLELDRTMAEGSCVTVVMVDADHFKTFNDTHGHLAGDQALQVLAADLRECARGVGFACRFGGEEFAVALPGAGVAGARDYVDAVARGLVEAFRGSDRTLTVSAGIAVGQGADEPIEAVLARADAAMYLAKAGGRDRAAWPDPEGTGTVVGGPSRSAAREALHVVEPAADRPVVGDEHQRAVARANR